MWVRGGGHHTTALLDSCMGMWGGVMRVSHICSILVCTCVHACARAHTHTHTHTHMCVCLCACVCYYDPSGPEWRRLHAGPVRPHPAYAPPPLLTPLQVAPKMSVDVADLSIPHCLDAATNSTAPPSFGNNNSSSGGRRHRRSLQQSPSSSAANVVGSLVTLTHTWSHLRTPGQTWSHMITHGHT